MDFGGYRIVGLPEILKLKAVGITQRRTRRRRLILQGWANPRSLRTAR